MLAGRRSQQTGRMRVRTSTNGNKTVIKCCMQTFYTWKAFVSTAQTCQCQVKVCTIWVIEEREKASWSHKFFLWRNKAISWFKTKFRGGKRFSYVAKIKHIFFSNAFYSLNSIKTDSRISGKTIPGRRSTAAFHQQDSLTFVDQRLEHLGSYTWIIQIIRYNGMPYYMFLYGCFTTENRGLKKSLHWSTN